MDGAEISRLRHKDGVSAFLVTAGVVDVVFSIVMNIHGFPANRAGRVVLPSSVNSFRRLGRPLMPTLLTLVLLVPMEIFPITKKVRFVVALRAVYLV